MKIKTILLMAFGAIALCGTASAQEVAIKTNFLTWATTTPNLALEFGLGKKTTLELSGAYNPFEFDDNSKFKVWMVQPELRFWTCERFNRGFWGIHAVGGEFNINKVKPPFGIWPKLMDYRYEGWYVGGGISYGYDWYLGPHWNLEATIGAGYIYVKNGRYDCAECGEKLEDETHNYVGPTKLGVSVSYLF